MFSIPTNINSELILPRCYFSEEESRFKEYDMLKDKDILRLKTLEEYQIFDTLPEEMYDDITAMAASICKMPIALITLVDEKRQFFKSHHGTILNQTPLKYSICSHAIESEQDIFEVPDLRTDDRFKDNPLVIDGPKIKSYYGAPFYSEQGIAFGTLCVISSEVTALTDDQKKALKSLSKQVVNLLELRKKNFQLQSYQKKLEHYSKDMEEFAFIAAHDLRAPVRIIKSFIKMLEAKNSDVWDDSDKMYFQFINDNTERMDTLVLDLLEYAKSNMNNTLEKEEIELKELVVSLFESLAKDADELHKPQLTISELPKIFFSKIAMTMVFQNLIANAVKYQAKDNIPQIKITHSETGTNWIFEIQDNGIGIGEEFADIIFEPFKRLHNQSEYTGSGLGLAACKKVIENLNGKIWMKSETGIGTTFTFSIPK